MSRQELPRAWPAPRRGPKVVELLVAVAGDEGWTVEVEHVRYLKVSFRCPAHGAFCEYQRERDLSTAVERLESICGCPACVARDGLMEAVEVPG